TIPSKEPKTRETASALWQRLWMHWVEPFKSALFQCLTIAIQWVRVTWAYYRPIQAGDRGDRRSFPVCCLRIRRFEQRSCWGQTSYETSVTLHWRTACRWEGHT